MTKILYAILIWLILSVSYICLKTTFSFAYYVVENENHGIQESNLYSKTNFNKFSKVLASECVYNTHNFMIKRLKLRWLNKVSNKAEQNKKSEKAIIFLHGFKETFADFIWFKNELKKHTNLPMYSINLSPTYGSIEEIAQNIRKKVINIQQQTGAKELIFVNHSMGGLVASYYTENLDKENYVSKVMTIGTPFHGTKTAVLMFDRFKNVTQMKPKSKFLEKLNQQIINSKAKYYNIAVQMDNIIYPWDSDFVKSNKVAKHIHKEKGHLGVLYSHDTVNKVSEWINAKES